MSEHGHDKDRHEAGVAIEAETTLDRHRRRGSKRLLDDGPDHTTLIMEALEKLAEATDHMAHELSERLEEVRGDFARDLQLAKEALGETQRSGLERLREITSAAEGTLRKVINEAAEKGAQQDGGLRQIMAEGLDGVIEQIERKLNSQSSRVREEVTDALQTQLEEIRGQIDALAERPVEAISHDDELQESLRQQAALLSTLQGSFENVRTELSTRLDKIATGASESSVSTEQIETAVAKVREQVQQSIDSMSKDLNENHEATLKGQRSVIHSLAEGMGLSQNSLEDRIASLDEKLTAMGETQAQKIEELLRAPLVRLEQWQKDTDKRVARWHEDQEQRLEKLEEKSREVVELANRLESDHQTVLQLIETERERTEGLIEQQQLNEARRLNNAGVARYHAGDFEQAKHLFERSVEIDTHFAEAFNNLGLCLTEMGDHEEATAAFETAVELDPELGATYNNLGYVLYLQENYEAAIQMYQEAIGRKHDTSAAFTNLGNAQQKLGMTEKAVAAWRKALEVDPSNERARQYLKRFSVGPVPEAPQESDESDSSGRPAVGEGTSDAVRSDDDR